MTTAITPPLKWHGGKSYLADKIIALMPPRCKNPNAPAPNDGGWLHYVEPFFGGGAVLLAMDPEGISEVVNDRNAALTNFWRVLQNKEAFADFQREVNAVPFSKVEFNGADQAFAPADPIPSAVNFFIRCRQSYAGRMKEFPPLVRSRTRRGMQDHVSAWWGCVEGLPEVHERLKRIVVLNDDALSVIQKQDGPRTLFYLDPPYLHETRATTKEYGDHEMTAERHGELLELLGSKELQGRFLLSGYHSELYDDWASACGWKCHEFKIDNKAAGGKTKRQMTECVWCNF